MVSGPRVCKHTPEVTTLHLMPYRVYCSGFTGAVQGLEFDDELAARRVISVSGLGLRATCNTIPPSYLLNHISLQNLWPKPRMCNVRPSGFCGKEADENSTLPLQPLRFL